MEARYDERSISTNRQYLCVSGFDYEVGILSTLSLEVKIQCKSQKHYERRKRPTNKAEFTRSEFEFEQHDNSDSDAEEKRNNSDQGRQNGCFVMVHSPQPLLANNN